MKKALKNKSQPISKRMVWEAWKTVRSKGGSPGVDKQSLKDFESDQEKQLYKVWNRMASGSYRPQAVREVSIPKANGKERRLGIPTVGDRVAQTVVKQYLEERMEAIFHEDSYGYRPNRGAHQAIATAQYRCWKYGWVIDLDIAGFFDNLDHGMLKLALDKHVPERWCRLYIERWLKSPIEKPNGRLENREKGTPQGGVISPLLANLFLHYVFDLWMTKHHPKYYFERYADDIIVHCQTEQEAVNLLKEIKVRMEECKLELHPEKTQTVFCPQQGRKAKYPIRKFTFLGYEFKARRVINKQGDSFIGFNPAVSPKAVSKLLKNFSRTGFQCWTPWSIEAIARAINPTIRGWITYFSRFNRHEMKHAFEAINYRLVRWVVKKFKRHKGSYQRAKKWLVAFADYNSHLFEHWKAGFLPRGYIRRAV